MESDLVVRTYNTLYARGARRRGWPDYPLRLAGAVETLDEAWPHQVGLIGLQEAGDKVTGCATDGSGRQSVTACFAALVGRRFGVAVRFVEHHELGIVWDDDRWEAVPGGGAWRIGRRRVLFSWRSVDFGAVRYLLGVKLRQRATGRVLAFFNTHLANDERRRDERAQQIDRLLAIVEEQVGPGELPPVLVGDLNFRPDERASYDRLARRFWLANEAVSGEDWSPVGVDHVWIGRSEHFSETSTRLQVLRVDCLELHGIKVSDHPLVSVRLAAGSGHRDRPARLKTPD